MSDIDSSKSSPLFHLLCFGLSQHIVKLKSFWKSLSESQGSYGPIEVIAAFWTPKEPQYIEMPSSKIRSPIISET